MVPFKSASDSALPLLPLPTTTLALVQAADALKQAEDVNFHAADRWWKMAILMEEAAALLPTQSRSMRKFWAEWAGSFKTRLGELGFQVRRG